MISEATQAGDNVNGVGNCETPKKVRKPFIRHPDKIVHQIKFDYLHGLGSVRELSIKYGISQYKTIESRASKEGWNKNKGNIVRLVEKTIEKAEESRQNRLLKHEERVLERMESYYSTLDRTKDQIGDLVEPNDLSSLVKTEATVDLVVRRALGATDKVDVSSGGKSLGENLADSVKRIWAMKEASPNGERRVWDIEKLKLESKNLED